MTHSDPDPIDLATEERLVRALRAREAEITVSGGDALARIRARTGRSRQRRARVRVALATATAAGVAAGGLALFAQGGDDAPAELATYPVVPEIVTSTTSPPTSRPSSTTSTTPPATTVAAPGLDRAPDALVVGDLAPLDRAEAGLIVWPLDSRSFADVDSVTFSYVTEVLGVDEPTWTVLGLDDTCTSGACTRLVAIDRPGEDGSIIGRAELLELVALDEVNWVITAVTSDEVTIDDLGFSDEESEITVEATGRAFEGTGLLTTRSRCDPVGITTIVALGAGPEHETFSATVPHAPCDAPVVVELSTGADPFEGAVPSVTAVAASREPVELDQDSRRLLVDEALGLLGSFGGAGDPDGPPLSDRGVFVGGTGVFADLPTPFVRLDPERLLGDETVDWSPAPDACEPGACELPTAGFLALGPGDAPDPAAVTVTVDLLADRLYDPFLYGPPDQLDQLADFRSVTVEVPPSEPGELDWRVYHVWFDWITGSPRVIAVWRWGWTP